MRDLQPTSCSTDKTKSFHTKIRNMTKMSAFTSSIQHSIGSASHSNQTRKRNKRHPNWKGGNKTVIVCRWHDSIHRKPYRLHQKRLNLISDFSKTAGYKINIQKSKAFLYTNKERSDSEIRKNIPFAIATRKIKYLRINLTKEVKQSLFADDMIVSMENPMLHQKTTRPNKWIWQNSWIQSQSSEIKGILLYQQWNIRNRNQGKNPIWYSNKKNKVPRNQPNQGGKRPVLRKLHNTEKRN